MVKDQTLYKSTTVPPERTRGEIDKILKDFGIQNRAWITKNNEDVLVFEWRIQSNGNWKDLNFELRPPAILQQKRVWNQKTSRTEKIMVQNDAIAYRLLYNYVKNKLEAIRVGMVTVENEFMAQIRINLPSGRNTTLGQEMNELILSNRIENALEDRSQQKPPIRNVTNEGQEIVVEENQ